MNNRLIRPPSRHNVQRFFELERIESPDNFHFKAYGQLI